MNTKYPQGTDCNSMQNDIDELEEQLEAKDSVMLDASYLVAQTITDLESIANGALVLMADQDLVPKGIQKKRKMTMKDAKMISRRSAFMLRQAWELLDPTTKPFM